MVPVFYDEGAQIMAAHKVNFMLKMINDIATVKKIRGIYAGGRQADVMIIRFNISYKFSQFLGNVYRILLEEFCTIVQFELTETLAFYEYRKKQIDR
jgi:CRISPR/Cas system CMR-associated protein Cmr5 small subunit